MIKKLLRTTFFRSWLLLLLSFLHTGYLKAQTFYLGVDLSYVNEMEDCGASFNIEGTPVDPYSIFADEGANLVRLRLWHSPSWYDDLNNGNRYSDFEDVRISIMRAKAEGLQVLLDFHLSDNWADPSKQIAPAAWTPVLNNLPVLQDSLYNYIYNTLHKLAVEDLLPELVQIGNETNRGILLSKAQNDAGWILDWDRNSALFNSAIDAVRDIETSYAAEIKIAIHIADPAEVDWFIDQFQQHGVNDFDIIGTSYYYQWHDHTVNEVGDYIQSLKTDFPGKEVMILETAYPWTSANADFANNILSTGYPGYVPFSPVHQRQWMIDLTQEVIDHGGSGVVYWEPAWVSTGCASQWATGSSWDNATFFNSNDELIGNGGILWLSHPYDFVSSVDQTYPQPKAIEIHVAGNKLIIERISDLFFNEKFQVEILTVDGKIVDNSYHIGWMQNQLVIDIADLHEGFFVVSIFDKTEVVSGSFLKYD